MKRLSKAQKISVSIFKASIAWTIASSIVVLIVVRFGGAYSGAIEYLKLSTWVCWLIAIRILIVASMPFAISTVLKYLLFILNSKTN